MSDEKNKKCVCGKEIPKGIKKCSCGEWLSLWDKIIHAYITPIIISLIAGALLFSWGQDKERAIQEKIKLSERREQNDKMIILLKSEFSQNFANLNNVEALLKQDLQYLEKGKITIIPLCNFDFDAWEQAKFSGASFLLDAPTKDYIRLTNCYFTLKIIQRKIEDREAYRVNNEVMANFVVRMKSLDDIILDNIEKVRPIFKEAQDYLYKIHDWKVKGGSYHIDNGLVVDIEIPEKQSNSILQDKSQKN